MKIQDHYKRNYKQMVGLAVRTTVDNNRVVAEECVQQAYTNLLDYISRGGELIDGKYEHLLYKILFNAIHDSNEQELKRGMSGRRPDNFNWIEDQVDEIPSEQIPSIVKRICLKIIMGNYLKTSLNKHRVLKLYFIEGYNHKEIACAVGLTEKTSRNIVYQELNKLRKVMQ